MRTGRPLVARVLLPAPLAAPLTGLALAVALVAVGCAPKLDRRATLVSRDGAPAEDGPRLVERLRTAGMKAELGPPTSAATLVVDTVDATEVERIVAGVGRPTRVHVHAVRALDPTAYPTREAAAQRIALWSPELGVQPTIAEEPRGPDAAAPAPPTSPVIDYRVAFIDEVPIVDAKDVVDGAPDGPDDRGPARVVFALSEDAAKRFEAWTKDHVGTQLAILVDDRVVGLPIIQSAIPGGRLLFFVGGAVSAEAQAIEARILAASISSGPLRGTWTVERVETLTP